MKLRLMVKVGAAKRDSIIENELLQFVQNSHDFNFVANLNNRDVSGVLVLHPKKLHISFGKTEESPISPRSESH